LRLAAAALGGLLLLRGVFSAIRTSGAPEEVSIAAILLQTVLLFGLAAAGLALLANLTLVLTGYLPSALGRTELVVAAWLFGALAFLNTWDSPIYLALLLGVLAWLGRGQTLTRLVTRLATTALAVVTGAVLLYLPWYPSFSSQAGGILPNAIFPTKLQHFVVMFGVALVPILAWLIQRVRQSWSRPELAVLLRFGLGVPIVFFLFSSALAGFLYVAFFSDPLAGEAMLTDLGISEAPLRAGMGMLVRAIGTRRLAHSGTALALGFILALVAVLLGRAIPKPGSGATEPSSGNEPPIKGAKGLAGSRARRVQPDQPEAIEPWPFIVILVALGALLVITPEFFYLRDLFGTRMNTVFKFYFAAWLLWGIAGAFALAEVWPERPSLRQAPRLLLALPLLFGLTYPILATWTKTEGFAPLFGRTLDGAAYLGELSPPDYAAVQWINRGLPTGVVVEAVGGSYSQYGRIAAHTGLPTVLGWDFHEVQWRGTAEPQGSRRGDVEILYEAPDWETVQPILRAYDVSYVYVGPLELSTYQPLDERKFELHMTKIYDSDEVRIYARDPGISP
jgi:uncharacterized membrane protein